MRRLFKLKIFNITGLLSTIVLVSFLLGGCVGQSPDVTPTGVPNVAPQQGLQQSDSGTDNYGNNKYKSANADPAQRIDDIQNGENKKGNRSVDIDVDDAHSGKMISYDVATIGRSNPFMPFNEMLEYEKARSSAIAEANSRNAQIRKIKNLQNYAIREQDDISPYKFNLPVPPTALDTNTVAAKITKTKVVGIMYNIKSPSAIINVDNKDYLVRPGDKIIGQEYKVVKITPNWVTAAMGSNVYSAAIGEAFSKDRIETNQTDIYNLKERFGGRKI
jgi:Tfp pilus assembly protein PilP